MAVATRTRRETVYRIQERIRAKVDLFTEWRECDTHISASRALTALNEWFHETDPPLGTYRIESTRDGYFVTATWHGPE